MSAKDFVIVSQIGKGSYSSVYKVKRKSDGKEYALKKVRLSALKDKEKSNALNEVRILASISSEYIISYKEAFLEDSTNSLCIIMEFADGGDLQQKIDNNIKRRTSITESEVWKMVNNTLSGLKVLHHMKIVHRDIKTANIFISDGLYKLGDLNVSKILDMGLAYTQTGTPYYASPEVWRDQPYDSKSDIWSLGCVIYEMCTLHPPFRAKDMQQLYKRVQLGKFEKIPSRYSVDLQKFIQTCLQLDPRKRPTCDELLKSQYMHGKIEGQLGQQNNLLDTIKMPKNLQRLKDVLPRSKYLQTQTTSERIPSRRSDLTQATKQEEIYIPKKNPSHRTLLPQIMVRNKASEISISNNDYVSYHQKKRQEGSYDIVRRRQQYPYYSQQPNNIRSVRTKPNPLNDDIEQKLLLRQKHLLGGGYINKQHNLGIYRDVITNPIKLPPLIVNQKLAVQSLKINQNRQNYQYNRPSWWG